MQGILVLGGNGTRLNLFSKRVSNKSLALVYDRLVFEYPLNTLVRAGITDIVMVLGGRYAGLLMNVIGEGKEFGVDKLTYVYQRHPKGISDAIYKSKGSIKGKCAVILGDNFFETDINSYVKEFTDLDLGCSLFVKEVDDPERYGVAEVKENFNLTSGWDVKNIVEKPKTPKTNKAVTGLYFYDNTLFKKIESLTPSKRGELEVTDLNMLYVKDNNCLAYPVEGYWNDMGTFDSILDTSNFVKNNKYQLNYKIDAWKS